jgi:hypothetical protein
MIPPGGKGALALEQPFLRNAISNRATLFALLLAGAALVSALIAPMIAGNMRLMMLFFAAFFGFILVLFLLRTPVLGVCLTIVAALAVPFAIGTGTATGINAGVIMLILSIGLWFLDMIARQRKIRLLPSRPVLVALVFGLVSVVAFGFGQLFWFPTRSAPLTAQFAGLMIFLLAIGAFLFIGHRLNTVRELQWMTWVFIAVGSVYIAARFLPGSERYIYRLFPMHATLGCLFYVWLVSMSLSQALFNRDLARQWRIGLIILVSAIAYLNMGVARFWLSGWLPALVGACAVVFFARPRLGIALGIIGVTVLMLQSQFVSGLLSEGDNTYSTITRLGAWRIILEISKANPIFGLGMANYYYFTPLYSILGYRGVRFNSHNNYIDIFAQAGILGVICFIWLGWEVWRLGWGLRNIVPEGFPKAYVYGALGGLAGTLFAALLGDWVIPFVYNIGLEGFRASMLGWIFLGGFLVLEKLYANTAAEKAG